ncbi:MAG: SagB/ThcOx family dehydrogenase [Verrucomicrobiota bacterium]
MKSLPEPNLKGQMSVEEAIARRRSVREFTRAPLTERELGQLLWAAQGITDRARGFRAAPSAGATFPLETYVATLGGIFRYRPDKHALEPVRAGDTRRALAAAALGQRWIESASAVIVFTAVPERTTRRYGSRGLMYIHMEAGHAAENLHLQAVAMGLGSAPVGAFDEAAVAKILNLTKTETPLYLIPVGKEARK